MSKFQKNCPYCDVIVTFANINTFRRSVMNGRLCAKCSRTLFGLGNSFAKGNKLTAEHRSQISKANQNNKHREGKLHSEETKQKMRDSWKQIDWSGPNNPFFGKTPSDAVRKRIRQSMLLRIETKTGRVYPNFNHTACDIIDVYGKTHGFSFKHANNGGEHHIRELGYFVDGYDEENNVVIEYYERRHSKCVEQDARRQKEIEDFLGCTFIILKEDELQKWL